MWPSVWLFALFGFLCVLKVDAYSTIPYRRFNLLALRLRGNYKENKTVGCITNKRSIVSTLRGNLDDFKFVDPSIGKMAKFLSEDIDSDRPHRVLTLEIMNDWYVEYLYERLKKVKSQGEAEHEIEGFYSPILELGEHYISEGDYASAERVYEKFINNILSDIDVDDEYMVTALVLATNPLGDLYVRQGKYVNAELLYVKYLDKMKESKIEGLRGINDVYTREMMSKLGDVYVCQGKYASAEPLYINFINFTERHAYDPYTMVVMTNLVALYMRQGKFGSAKLLYEEYITKVESVTGNDDTDLLLPAMIKLADLYVRQRDNKSAERLYYVCLENIKEALKHSNDDRVIIRDLLEVHSKLVELRVSKGDYASAELLHLQFLEEMALGLNAGGNPDKVTCMLEVISKLGELHLSQGDYASAELLYVKRLSQFECLLGVDNPGTLKVMSGLVNLYIMQRNYASAVLLLGESLKVESFSFQL